MPSHTRTYHKGWQSDRPLQRDSRRVKWYQGQYDIRLMFEDQYGRTNRYYTDPEKAQKDYEAFISGKFGALSAPW